MTTLAPLLDAAPIIQVHATAALTALALGPVALFRRRRDRLHRVVGRVWVLAMATTALSSFGIHSMPVLAGFGPIHLLSVLALVSLVFGVRAAIRRDIARHRRIMRTLYLFGMGLTALFTLWPGRIMQRVLFADGGAGTALALAAILLVAVVCGVLWRSRSSGNNPLQRT